jgi:hypothetical protein
MDNIERFKNITDYMIKLYEEKNKNYGNSFDKTLDDDGLIVAKIRLSDKLNRFSNIIKNGIGETGESITDTLIDLANYAIMTVMWINKK